MHPKYLIVLIFISTVVSCSRNPYKATNKVYRDQSKTYAKLLRQYPVQDSVDNSPYFVGTTNFSIRRPNYVVIHHTAQDSCAQTLRTFTIPRTQVSSHYVVCREGMVFHMLNDYFRAHHAGISRWGNNTDINSSSIGIEIDNNGTEPFSESQMNSLLALLGRLKRAYNIPQGNFIGHADIAPGRKVDPSRQFSWKILADNGYGYWYDTTNVIVPPDFNAMQALRIIGYNVKDTGIAIQSYKIHFSPQDSTRIIGDADRKILFDLMQKYQ
ncbi:MAG: N-acetylmuramoyl-L-alanine amidase [Chitinophagaceae bacterium]|nr:N-acetylmuramoyl-L-alanine amidase [Chitinophagaceae bacterium]